MRTLLGSGLRKFAEPRLRSGRLSDCSGAWYLPLPEGWSYTPTAVTEMRVRTQDTWVLTGTLPWKDATKAGAALRSLLACSECTSNYEKALDVGPHLHHLGPRQRDLVVAVKLFHSFHSKEELEPHHLSEPPDLRLRSRAWALLCPLLMYSVEDRLGPCPSWSYRIKNCWTSGCILCKDVRI